MAIKVNGTTVIDDSRNLANVGGLKTVNGTSLVGSGNISAGASTTFDAVGTYGFMVGNDYSGGWTSTVNRNATVSGSRIRFTNGSGSPDGAYTPSGTWRLMGGYMVAYNSGSGSANVWVRIS